MCVLRCWRLRLRLGRSGFGWNRYRCVDSVGVAPCCIAKYSSSEISCRACRPPRVSQTIEEADALLQFFGSAVNVDLQAARAEVAIHYAEGYTERVGYDRKRWEELGGFSVEKMDHSCRGETLSDVRGC